MVSKEGKSKPVIKCSMPCQGCVEQTQHKPESIGVIVGCTGHISGICHSIIAWSPIKGKVIYSYGMQMMDDEYQQNSVGMSFWMWHDHYGSESCWVGLVHIPENVCPYLTISGIIGGRNMLFTTEKLKKHYEWVVYYVQTGDNAKNKKFACFIPFHQRWRISLTIFLKRWQCEPIITKALDWPVLVQL